MNFIELFNNADWMIKVTILVLVSMSIFSWSIIFEKLSYLRKVEAKAFQIMEAFSHTNNLHFLSAMPVSPLKNVFSMVKYDTITSDTERRMEQQLNKESDELYKKLGVIGAIASSAPFIGLFGTVWGIMNSLQVIGGNNNNQLNIVAPMIGEALFVTAIGFVVAIPASLMYNMINQRIERINNQWLGFLVHVTHTIAKY